MTATDSVLDSGIHKKMSPAAFLDPTLAGYPFRPGGYSTNPFSNSTAADGLEGLGGMASRGPPIGYPFPDYNSALGYRMGAYSTGGNGVGTEIEEGKNFLLFRITEICLYE